MIPARALRALRQNLRALAERLGVPIGDGPPRLPNTRAPLAVTEWARDHGCLPAMRDRLMEDCWLRGLDIESPEVIGAAAAACGLDPAAAVFVSGDQRYLRLVDAAGLEAAERGVSCLPTFFFGRLPVLGCQTFEVLASAAERAGAAPRARMPGAPPPPQDASRSWEPLRG